jgi:hypothetical protein
VTPEEARSFVEELARITAEGTMPPSGDPTLASFVVAHGLFRCLLRLSQAALGLVANGYALESVVLRRSVLEYSTCLIWVSEKRQAAVDALNANHSYERQRLTKMMLRAPDGWAEDVLADAHGVDLLEVAKASGTHLVGMTGRLKAKGLDSLEAMWNADSRIAHPSITAVRHFFEESPDGAVNLLSDPPDQDQTAEATASVVTVGLFNGASAFNGLMPGEPWASGLNALAQAHGYNLQAVGDPDE